MLPPRFPLKCLTLALGSAALAACSSADSTATLGAQADSLSSTRGDLEGVASVPAEQAASGRSTRAAHGRRAPFLRTSRSSTSLRPTGSARRRRTSTTTAPRPSKTCLAGTLCSADNLCRDRPNVPSERAALLAYLRNL
jgi:hypothetical protein